MTTKTLEQRVEELEKRLDKIEGLESDPIFDEVVKHVLQCDEISASHLQRRFSLGYNRAAKLLEDLEEKGYVEESNQNKPRKVLTKK
jgi:S-DNA-T family DNA segregation ATPase FtsK/SpoIIIE